MRSRDTLFYQRYSLQLFYLIIFLFPWPYIALAGFYAVARVRAAIRGSKDGAWEIEAKRWGRSGPGWLGEVSAWCCSRVDNSYRSANKCARQNWVEPLSHDWQTLLLAGIKACLRTLLHLLFLFTGGGTSIPQFWTIYGCRGVGCCITLQMLGIAQAHKRLNGSLYHLCAFWINAMICWAQGGRH